MNSVMDCQIYILCLAFLYMQHFFLYYIQLSCLKFIYTFISIFFGLLKLCILKDFEKINLKIFYYSTMLFGLLTISIAYTTADHESINETFFKYIKLLYLPILFYIVSNKNIINNAFNSFFTLVQLYFFFYHI